jgi:signal peptide peptidase SppA
MDMNLRNWLSWIPVDYFRNPRPVVAVLRLHGVIGQTGRFRQGLDISSIGPLVETAFEINGLTAVALAINSPGGAPAQSSLIYARIRALAEEKEVPVLAFAEDVAASGGYWLACAADEIYADKNSIVGSIGVVSAGFGFQDLLGKIGVERRIHAQGDRKSMLDPFEPEREADVKRLLAIQKDIHGNFKDLIRERRDGRVKISDRKLFSGDIWTGGEALEAGLVDGLGEMREILHQKYGDQVRIREIGGRSSILKRLFGRRGVSAAGTDAEGIVGNLPGQLLSAVEDRAFWSRFGL